jgi:hemerythrin-like domain-containing protein
MNRCVSVGGGVDALETLLDEHRTIGMTIGLLKDSVKGLQSGKAPSPEFFEEIFDVLRNFVDRCHHGKEEEVLFPLVRKRDAEEAGIVSLLLEEHEKGRAFVRAMKDAVSKNDRAGIIKNANGYTALLLQHIRRENMIFPTWINPLEDETKKEISERFDEIEAEAIGPGKHQEYLQTIERLKNGNVGMKE